MGLNLTVLQGSISKEDPIIREFSRADGKTGKTAFFRIAVPRDYKDKEGNKVYDFFSCKTFGNTARYVEKFYHKGDLIVVEGRLQNEEYTKEGITYRHDVLYVTNTYPSNLRSTDQGQQQIATPERLATDASVPEDVIEDDELLTLPDDLLPIPPE